MRKAMEVVYTVENSAGKSLNYNITILHPLFLYLFSLVIKLDFLVCDIFNVYTISWE